MMYNDECINQFVTTGGAPGYEFVSHAIYNLARDLQDARKELEEAKKASVWRDAPEEAKRAWVHWQDSYGGNIAEQCYYRTLPKTPKQELIDSFVERHSMAFRCSDLNKELLEAFVKEYEEMKK